MTKMINKPESAISNDVFVTVDLKLPSIIGGSDGIFARIHSNTTNNPRWRSINSNAETDPVKDISRTRKGTGY